MSTGGNARHPGNLTSYSTSWGALEPASPMGPSSRSQESCLARLRQNQCKGVTGGHGASGAACRPHLQYSLLARDEIKSLVDQRVEIFHLATRSGQ